MMKILLVRMYPNKMSINNYNEQFIGLAKALIRKGHICDIVFYNGKEKNETQKIKIDDDKEITIYWIKGKNFFKNAIYNKELYQIIKNYDIVQTTEYDQIGNIKLWKKIDKPLFIYHGPYYCNFNKGYNLKCKVFDNLFLRLNKKYKQVPVITKSTLATKFIESKGFKTIKTIGVGLDEDSFKEENNIESMAVNELKESKGEYKYILYIGKIEERRNTKKLLDIIKRVQTINQKIKLIIVGKGEKAYMDECWNYAKIMGIKDKIAYIPELKQKELANIYKICDIFILPTAYDIFGMVLLEAMYNGIPVITTLNGGSDTIIEHGKNGFIYDLLAEEQISKQILKLISNTEYSENIGREASITIKEKFLWSKLADKFIEIYEKY